MEYCKKTLSNRSKYSALATKLCFKEKGHAGKCSEFPYLDHFTKNAPTVKAKVVRDATMTTGASWKSDEAGPNRIIRWVMLLDDATLKTDFKLDMGKLKPGVVAKLRDKAATYDQCMEVAAMLTLAAYEMTGAPAPTKEVGAYLEQRFGGIVPGKTTCIVCRLPLAFDAFKKAARGKAEIETAHKNPREHNEKNVGFAHRECNIAQGNKPLDEFYAWIDGILKRVDR